MKLAVSNIAWENDELEEHLALLQELKCDGVEIAPSCIWEEPVNASNYETEALKKLVNKYNLLIPAFHALLFTRPDLQLFGDKTTRNETVSYLKRLIQLAGDLSVKVLVYGSPASRRLKNKPYNECYQTAVDIFRELAKEASLYNTCFCIEPLGPSENEFIQTADEGYRIVNDVDNLHFGLHLDAKAMVDAKEDFGAVFQKYGAFIKHFHVGDPGLSPPGYTGVDHSLIGNELAKTSYNGFISIEMKRGFGNTKEIIKKAVQYVREKYLLTKIDKYERP